MNLGNLAGTKKEYQTAVKYYLKVIEDSPFNESKQDVQWSLLSYNPTINSFNAFVDAHTNLAALYVNLGEQQLSFTYC